MSPLTKRRERLGGLDRCKTGASHVRDTCETRARHVRDTCETRARHMRDTGETRAIHMRHRRETGAGWEPERLLAQRTSDYRIQNVPPQLLESASYVPEMQLALGYPAKPLPHIKIAE